MTIEELSVRLLETQTQIAACEDHWLIRATLRQRAAALAAAFVDQAWAVQEQFVTHPPLRDGKAMSEERPVPGCPF